MDVQIFRVRRINLEASPSPRELRRINRKVEDFHLEIYRKSLLGMIPTLLQAA
jgi:hypothetical protein